MRGTIFELLKVGDFSHYSFQKYNSHSVKYDSESGCMRALLAAQSPERIPADITTKNPYSPIGVKQYTSECQGREFPKWMDGWGSKGSFNLPHYLKYYQSRCVHSKYGPKNGQVFFSKKLDFTTKFTNYVHQVFRLFFIRNIFCERLKSCDKPTSSVPYSIKWCSSVHCDRFILSLC